MKHIKEYWLGLMLCMALVVSPVGANPVQELGEGMTLEQVVKLLGVPIQKVPIKVYEWQGADFVYRQHFLVLPSGKRSRAYGIMSFKQGAHSPAYRAFAQKSMSIPINATFEQTVKVLGQPTRALPVNVEEYAWQVQNRRVEVRFVNGMVRSISYPDW